MPGKKNNPTCTHTTPGGAGTFVFKCLSIKALPPYLQKEATETPEILQESQPQAGRVRQRKVPLSKHSLRGSPIPAPGLSKTRHAGPLTWNSHEHHPHLCTPERILRAQLELRVLTRKGTTPAPAKQSN